MEKEMKKEESLLDAVLTQEPSIFTVEKSEVGKSSCENDHSFGDTLDEATKKITGYNLRGMARIITKAATS